MRRTIPVRAHCLPIGDRGTRSRPQAIHRAKPMQLPLRALPEFSGLNTVAKNGLANLGNQAMLTHPFPRPGQTRMVGRASQYVVAACSGILTLMSIFVGLKVSAATAGSGAAPALEIVDRAGKGDRLPLVRVIRPDTGSQLLENHVTRTPAPTQQLSDGCESLVSALSHSLLAQIAGRCIS
jgi:hypothetical protein